MGGCSEKVGGNWVAARGWEKGLGFGVIITEVEGQGVGRGRGERNPGHASSRGEVPFPWALHPGDGLAPRALRSAAGRCQAGGGAGAAGGAVHARHRPLAQVTAEAPETASR